MLTPQYKAAKIAYQLSVAEARALIVARDLYPNTAAVRDELPATPAGKVLRRLLRDP